jgi:sugar lactone lactonase YvrE
MSRKDLRGFRDATLKLLRDFPGNARVLHDLVAVEARLENTDASLNYLRRYLAMGLLPNFQSVGMQKLRDTGKLNGLPELKKNSEPVSSSAPVFKLSDPDLIAEDLAYDAGSKQLFISSVRERKIIRCDLEGHCADFAKSTSDQPLLGILALHVDEKAGLLWATMAGMNMVAGFKPDEDGKSAVLKYDLRSGKLLKAYDPGDDRKHALGDMTVAPSGEVYASDGLSGDVYVITPKKDALEALLPNGTFISPQTPALSNDGKILYVPDYTQGIAAVRLADHSVEWLKTDAPAATFAIDGMYAVRDRLIAVQNGTLPERVVEFHLGTPVAIASWKVLEANTAYLGDPTHGVPVGDDFYFIVNSGWDRVDEEKGDLKAGSPAEIRKISGLARR